MSGETVKQYPKTLAFFVLAYLRVPDKAADLLNRTAGRPGKVGRKMTTLLLAVILDAQFSKCKVVG